MSGLTDRDVRILEFYAKQGNRELYWNYLAQLPGNDGYGLLALGVVRNDSLPGRVANSFATAVAGQQSQLFGNEKNVDFTERLQETFGQALIANDLAQRKALLKDGRPDLALNLPYTGTLRSHDVSFVENDLNVNCWTPRLLLTATEQSKGQPAAQKVWENMLDNSGAGAFRAANTAVSVHLDMPQPAGHFYFLNLAKLEGVALLQRDAVDPNVIGSKFDYHTYDVDTGIWSRTVGIPPLDVTTKQNDPAEISKLNETRDVRLERAVKATQFHPDDPYKEIAKSPLVVSAQDPEQSPVEERRVAAMTPEHPDYALHQQIRQGVAALDQKYGREFDGASENMTASLTLRAREHGLERVDHVVLSNATSNHPAGHTIFVVQGELNNPAHLRTGMPAAEAAQAPVAESLQQLAVVGQQLVLARENEQQALESRSEEERAHSARFA